MRSTEEQVLPKVAPKQLHSEDWRFTDSAVAHMEETYKKLNKEIQILLDSEVDTVLRRSASRKLEDDDKMQKMKLKYKLQCLHDEN